MDLHPLPAFPAFSLECVPICVPQNIGQSVWADVVLESGEHMV